MELHRAPGLLFQKLRGNKAQELSTTHIKVKTFTSGLCFNVHLDSMHPPVKLAERKGEGGGGSCWLSRFYKSCTYTLKKFKSWFKLLHCRVSAVPVQIKHKYHEILWMRWDGHRKCSQLILTTRFFLCSSSAKQQSIKGKHCQFLTSFASLQCAWHMQINNVALPFACSHSSLLICWQSPLDVVTRLYSHIFRMLASTDTKEYRSLTERERNIYGF